MLRPDDSLFGGVAAPGRSWGCGGREERLREDEEVEAELGKRGGGVERRGEVETGKLVANVGDFLRGAIILARQRRRRRVRGDRRESRWNRGIHYC